MRFSTDDVDYLRSESGAAALAAVAELELTDATRLADIAAVRARFGDRAPVLVETTLLRRRAADKLGQLCPDFQVSNWLFTDEALQQATAAPVALRRAGRLAGGPEGRDVADVLVHDATCSIGTELAALHRSDPEAVQRGQLSADRAGRVVHYDVWAFRPTGQPAGPAQRHRRGGGLLQRLVGE